MQPVSNTPANELLEDYSFSISVELERLSYFDELFRAIKANADNSHSVKRLASLGEYIAQDFSHYSEQDLEQLQAQQGGNNE